MSETFIRDRFWSLLIDGPSMLKKSESGLQGEGREKVNNIRVDKIQVLCDIAINCVTLPLTEILSMRL